MQKDIKIGLALVFSMLFVLFGMRLLRESRVQQDASASPDELKITSGRAGRTSSVGARRPSTIKKESSRTTASAQKRTVQSRRSLVDQGKAREKSNDAKRQPAGMSDTLADRLKGVFKRAGVRTPAPIKYTIEPGDTLSGIAKEHYNNSSKWRIIYEANKKTIKDPDKLSVGLVIIIPPLPEKKIASTGSGNKEEKAKAAKRTVIEYTIREGDTLAKISKKFLGSESRYHEILRLNSAKIRDPDVIYPGQVILIPLDKRQ